MRVPLLNDDALERSSVVANCAMNRERRLTGSNGYGRELGVDIVAELSRRAASRTGTGPVRWLDLCCGTGKALAEAARHLAQAGLADRVQITGVDLAGHFAPEASASTVDLVVASATSWTPQVPGTAFDLVTCVHGLHYIGDKLAVLARAASWLTDDGMFIANFDAAGVRLPPGKPATRRLTAALKAAGFTYDGRARRIRRDGPGDDVQWPWTYLGADDTAGPNYTGQEAVDAHYG